MPGLYGFDVRGPSAIPMLQMHYWSNVLSILQDKLGVEVIVTSVPSTGSVALRAESLHRFLREKAVGKGINFIAHSMGGLDCRYLISRIRPTEYIPLSLTTIATPHRGSPFMDWCREHIGIGRLHHKEHAKTAGDAVAEMDPKTGHSSHSLHTEEEKVPSGKPLSSITSLPSSFTTLLLSLLDSPAYANLTSTYLNHVFNPQTPDNPAVKYFSVAGRINNVSVWHPLWLPKIVLDGFEERERERLREQSDPRWERSEEWGNDCLVTVQSARWGQFLGIMEGCDHWDLRGARGLDVELPSVSIPGLSITRGKGKKDNGRKREQENGEWNIADWTRFVQLWKSEEKAAKEAAREAGAEISKERQRENQATESGGKPDKEQADEVLKSSTDKLSAVFDWIVEQMPAQGSLKPLSAVPPAKQNLPLEVSRSEREKIKKRRKRGDLATKQDLERFYIALCRNLYDEGL
ncbi:lipase [Laetiporus sulphureus 93-53]|uniref:Lipase n=1 Tax=Laetiporus sulphureus 93-53 TaxID=1314785 RepID=A0A165HTI6_9APHY|nr:lipase [Laetiporus sulphureus 93-53]KZT12169.1 lipase [Laetiporus sulphureus 93-53]